MSLKLYGIEIVSEQPAPDSVIPVDSVQSDSSINYTQNGETAGSPWMMNQISALSMDVAAKEENNLITQYRELLNIPEVDLCVEEIVQEAVIFPSDGEYAVRLDLSNLDEKKYSKKVKDLMVEEFENIYDMLLFSRKGHDIFKRWLVDGRLNYYKVLDTENLEEGIQALTYIDPRKIKKVRESNRKIDPETGKFVINNYKEFFYYNENGISDINKEKNKGRGVPKSHMMGDTYSNHEQNAQVNILTRDSVAYAPSGILDASGSMVIGYLHKAIKAANNLQMMEDSMLIYKLSRAPERRVFYIDTGNLPKAKAEQYVKNIADQHRTKNVYDSKTGEIRNDRKFVALTEDFWLARGAGSKGTEISTLPGGMGGNDTDETEYFKEKLYDALGVPKGRFDQQPSMFSPGTQITRDEVRFSRLIARLRTNFNVLFEDILGTQLLLRNIISVEEWQDIRNQVSFVYAEDNYFKEAIQIEKHQQLASLVSMYDQMTGKWVSKEYVYKEVMGLTDDQIAEIEEQIEKEASTKAERDLKVKQTEFEAKSLETQYKQMKNESYDSFENFPTLSEDIIIEMFK